MGDGDVHRTSSQVKVRKLRQNLKKPSTCFNSTIIVLFLSYRSFSSENDNDNDSRHHEYPFLLSVVIYKHPRHFSFEDSDKRGKSGGGRWWPEVSATPLSLSAARTGGSLFSSRSSSNHLVWENQPPMAMDTCDGS
jgi:hypothetical protein